MSDNNSYPSYYKKIKISEALEKENIITDFNIDTRTNSIVIGLNHKYQKSIIRYPINIKNWTKFSNEFVNELVKIGVNKPHTLFIKGNIDEKYDKIYDIVNTNNNNNSNNRDDGETVEGNTKEEEKQKREFVTYKYSQMGKGPLHEAVIVNGLPFFIKYDHESKQFELVENIIENSRILRPPNIEEYPYTPYEFESNDDLNFYLEKARQITLDEVYNKCESIFLRYVDQDPYIISLLVGDSIWTSFQDLYSVTHYSEGVGDNDVGKSSIGYTFEYTAYRAVKGVAMSGANYYRQLGNIEPGQCVIIEDEGDSISEDPDKVKILKSGYEYNGKVPKINMNTRDQDQKWWKTYCYKKILAEKSLKEYKVKGLVDRTFSYHCRPGKVKYSIKEVVSENIHKNPNSQKLYDELLSFRKLMLCYRLVHYKDLLPDIETGLKNRDEELCKPLLQLFYGTKVLETEIIPTLEIFLKQRRDRKSNSIEAAIFPIIKLLLIDLDKVNQLDQVRTKELKYSDIWAKIISGAIKGNYDAKKPNQYETDDYSILYNNSLSTFISDKFGAKLDKKRDGSVLTFDIEKLQLFENIYGDNIEKNVKIKVSLKSEQEEREEGTDKEGEDREL